MNFQLTEMTHIDLLIILRMSTIKKVASLFRLFCRSKIFFVD